MYGVKRVRFQCPRPWALGNKMEAEAFDTRAFTIAMYPIPVHLVTQDEKGNDPSTPEPILDDKA